MAKDFDKTGRRFETGQPVKVNGSTATVIGGHEDGVSLMTDEGERIVITAEGENCADVEITGDAPDADGITALHEKWTAQADATRTAAKG